MILVAIERAYRGQNGKTSYLYSVLAKRPNYNVVQNAKCQIVKYLSR